MLLNHSVMPPMFWLFVVVVGFFGGSKMKLSGRVSTHGTVGHQIDPSWWTHQAIFHSIQCSTTGVTKALVCVSRISNHEEQQDTRF